MFRTRKILLFVISVALPLLLTQCAKPITPMPSKYPTALNDIHSTLRESIAENQAGSQRSAVPASVSSALLPAGLFYLPGKHTTDEKRFNVTADNTPAKAFFMGLVEGTHLNMIVDPKVDGVVSLDLKNVTIDEAMDAAHDIYGYQYRKMSYGYEVLPQTIETEIFNVNYLDMIRKGSSVTTLSTGQISDKVGTTNSGTTSGGQTPTANSANSQQLPPSGSSVNTTSSFDFWKGLRSTLQTIIGNKAGRSVAVNPQAGIVVVRAMPPELRSVAAYLDRIQSSMDRQVILEAKILEVQLNDNYQAGIDWGVLRNIASGAGDPATHAGGTQSGNQAFDNIGLKAFSSSMFTLNIKGNFSALINLLQTQGNVQVLSSPRLSTVNNQKAVIKVGQDEFFVTSVSTTNTTNSAGLSTPTQDVGLTPFFSGITLDVTPQISSDGEVVLHIHPSVSSVTDKTKTIQVGNTSGGAANQLILPLALSSIRESDNIVHAQNGQVVVIGGLMQNNTNENIASTPWVTKVPFFGALFRRTAQASTKSELVILLRPVIVSSNTWSKQLQESNQRFEGLNRGFHAGGLPEVFGTEGEKI